MQPSVLLALAGLATLVPATPVTPPLPHALPQARPIAPRQANDSAPCAQVSQAVIDADGLQLRGAQVPAKLAYDCINSVPLNATSAKRLLQGLPPYVYWQSTLTALKNPPEEYQQKVQPPLDILAGLADIEADVDAGKYESEFEFGWSLYTLFQAAHDGHFAYVPDSVGLIFNYGRPVPLVSVSEDGKKLPAIFAFHDVLGLQFKNISYTPSPVVEIDGQDATEFLESWSQWGSLQDRDALYNNVFYELAQVSLGLSGSGTGMFTGGGRARLVYPGPTTTLTFANGTSYTMENYARVLQSFAGITSGEKLANEYFYYGGFTNNQMNADAQARISTMGGTVPFTTAEMPKSIDPELEEDPKEGGSSGATPLGYPNPVVPGPYNLINGFFIDAPGYEDVAVLQVPNFVGDATAEVAFQRTTQKFLPAAVAAGKTKLIIDLQANGGGTILQGYDMFKQLFPNIEPYGANRFRATDAADLIGQSYSEYGSKTPRTEKVNSTVRQVQSSYFDYHTDLTLGGESFDSWDQKFGPWKVNDDMYTIPARWNLSDVHITYNSGGIYITGYGPLANASQAQPFKAENIVILTDGYCASTCTIFTEFLTKQAGVKTIAMGGRSNSDPIQAIGGVKGTNNYGFGYIQNLAQVAVGLASGDLKARLNNSVLLDYYNDIVFYRAATTPGVNVRDGLKYNDTSGIALQFIYEEADCRLYYTPEMTVDATAIWKAAADAQWGNSGLCVSGSGYGKRATREVTTKLRRRGLQGGFTALRQFEAFEKTFDLETECHMTGDGFMHP